jgi:hypothetical protein
VADHLTETKHNIDFTNMEVIGNIHSYHPCIIREAIEINIPTTSNMKTVIG